MTGSLAPRPTFRWLFLCGLIGIVFCAGLEIEAMFVVPQDWSRLLSTLGTITVAAYLLLLVLGLASLILSWFFPAALVRLFARFARLGRARWLGIAAALLSIPWFYLYSSWQGIWPGPWTQFIFALGLATCIAWLAQPDGPHWMEARELTLGLAIFLYPRAVLELRAWYTQALLYRGATLVGYLLLLTLAFWLFTFGGQATLQRLADGRRGLGRARWILAVLFLCGPLLYLAVAGADFYAANPAIRFSLLLIDLHVLGFLTGDDRGPALSLKAIVVSAFALAAISFVTNALLLVVNYPFSLSWSEGNRFYDYSLIFGQGLYDYPGTIVNPYGSPGRYILWGIVFLSHGLPIAVHRFWNIVVNTVPPLLVGWLAARKLGDPYLRVGWGLFIALLFTVLSPLHPPIVLAAALVLMFTFDSSPLRRAIVLALASFYVGTSRWTWIPVTAAWAVLSDLLLYYAHRQGNLFKRLLPAVLLGLVAFVPGLISGYTGLPLSSGAREYHQPLLWYRLLPNPTFPLGVLFSTILISGPALCILVWWVRSGRWKLDWVQQLATGGALLGFLGAGLIVSTKIGGGADLHNLDMYLMTLAMVLTFGLYSMSASGKIDFLRWPVWTQLVLAFMILYPLYEFTPFWSGSAVSPRPALVKPQEVTSTLQDIQSAATRAQSTGDVLFMDQRQLITFGYIHGVPFIPEYEKKYMMDQAMAGNADYFREYYQDLSRKRFSLIVTEILHTRQETGADFNEENNAWVKWVSDPTLCFYEPTMINRDINLELLAPRQQPTGCESYLSGGE